MKDGRQYQENQYRVMQPVQKGSLGVGVVDNRNTAQQKLIDIIQRSFESKTPFVDNRDTSQIRLMDVIQRMGMEEELQMKPVMQLCSDDESRDPTYALSVIRVIHVNVRQASVKRKNDK